MKQISLLALCATCLVLVWCGSTNSSNPTPLKAWDTALITYTISDMKGNVLETNSWAQPRPVVVWAGNDFIKVVQDLLVGKEVWYADTLTVKPEEGFWYLYDSRNIQQLPLKMFTIPGMNPAVWETLDLWGVKGIVKSINGTWDDAVVVVDLNPYQSRNDVSVEFTVVWSPDPESNSVLTGE